MRNKVDWKVYLRLGYSVLQCDKARGNYLASRRLCRGTGSRAFLVAMPLPIETQINDRTQQKGVSCERMNARIFPGPGLLEA